MKDFVNSMLNETKNKKESLLSTKSYKNVGTKIFKKYQIMIFNIFIGTYLLLAFNTFIW